MSLNEEVDLLRKIPLFANIEPSKLKLLAFTSERLKFREGTELFHQGDMGDFGLYHHKWSGWNCGVDAKW